jgi:hypothetical protein
LVLVSVFNRWRKDRFGKVSHQFTNHLLFVSFAEVHALTNPSSRGCFLTRLFGSQNKFFLSLHILPVEAAIRGDDHG